LLDAFVSHKHPQCAICPTVPKHAPPLVEQGSEGGQLWAPLEETVKASAAQDMVICVAHVQGDQHKVGVLVDTYLNALYDGLAATLRADCELMRLEVAGKTLFGLHA